MLMRYEGIGFIPSEVKQPDCSRQTRGFGLYLIQKICKKAEYFKDENDMNCVCLVAEKEERDVS